jgi:hypothetical protein
MTEIYRTYFVGVENAEKITTHGLQKMYLFYPLVAERIETEYEGRVEDLRQ